MDGKPSQFFFEVPATLLVSVLARTEIEAWAQIKSVRQTTIPMRRVGDESGEWFAADVDCSQATLKGRTSPHSDFDVSHD